MAAMSSSVLDTLNSEALRELAQSLLARVASLAVQVESQDRELVWRQTKIDQLTHELALHKRWRFGARAEQMPLEQARLFEETIDPKNRSYPIPTAFSCRRMWV